MISSGFKVNESIYDIYRMEPQIKSQNNQTKERV